MKKILSAISALALAASSMAVSASAEDGGMRDITTMELVKEMGVGINLGNTFESCGSWIDDSEVKNFETAWGSPVITQKMIQGMADEGFGVLRIPVAWSNMMDFDNDYQINADYMARVKEVTEWALDADMYVIVNIHWDSGWWEDFPTKTDECMHRYERMWQQICDGFAEYDEHVMFESLNEEGGWSSVWDQWAGTQEQKEQSYGLLNEINQKFVDLVRSQDNNNAKRHLLIAGYITDVDLTCDPLFKMPEDPMNRCAVSVHYYSPSSFAIADDSTTWATPRTFWGTGADYTELKTQMNKLKTTFVDNGVPVIIGECASASRLNKEASELVRYNLAVIGEAVDNELCPVIWDVAMGEDTDERIYSIYSRKLCKLGDDDFKAGLQDIFAGKKAAEITGRNLYAVDGDDGSFAIDAATTSDGKITYASADENLATVDENGVVTPLRKGVAKIIVTSAATDEYRKAEKIVYVRVEADKTGIDDVTSSEPSNSESSSESNTSSTVETSSSETSADTSSKTESSSSKAATSSKAASNNNTANPATGAAYGLGAVAAVLAAAIVIKKKK